MNEVRSVRDEPEVTVVHWGIMKFGLIGKGEVELVDFDDVVLALAPKPSGGFH